jgi:hypothetical protein
VSVFSGWLMVGFGAAFTLIVANIDTVSKFISLAYIKFALILFLVGLVVAVLAKLVGTFVAAGVAGRGNGGVLEAKIAAAGKTFDPDIFFTEFQKGYFPIQRWLITNSLDKVHRGDMAAGARLIAKMGQVHGMLVIVHAFLAISAALVIALGVKL